MTAMSAEAVASFLAERRVAVLGAGRERSGPLLAPIWYCYLGEQAFEFCMGGSSAKAKRLTKEGRATVCVHGDDHPYRYVMAEGPVTLQPLGEGTYDAVRAMASRYLGPDAGRRYAEPFSTPDEVVVTLRSDRWQAVVV